MGDEDLAFDSNLEDVSSITMKRWWIELTIADKTITFTPGMFKAKSLASQIENAMEFAQPAYCARLVDTFVSRKRARWDSAAAAFEQCGGQGDRDGECGDDR